MKKVLVLAVALVLMAAPAALASSVVNSKHNLASDGGQTIKSDNVTEVCVFCHTPHGGSKLGPLWNRSKTADLTSVALYNSSTLTDTAGAAGDLAGVASRIGSSDAVLCFSCHDGTNLTDGLHNPGPEGDPTFTGFTGLTTADLFATVNGATDLENDHPIAFNYATSQAGDTAGLKAVASLPAAINVEFGATQDQMWCSSCHDVHDDQFGPFLVMSNTGSDLCLGCHIK